MLTPQQRTEFVELTKLYLADRDRLEAQQATCLARLRVRPFRERLDSSQETCTCRPCLQHG